MANAIEVAKLTKIYPGGLKAVDEVSFNIEEGEIFGFLGPNGAGKTTTIMMLITLTNPTSGTAKIRGHDIQTERDAVRNCIGYVSQDVAVDDQLTGRENILLQGKFYHLPKDTLKQRSDEVLEMLDLTDRAKDKVETYSGGMRKRLDIAEGLIHRPEVLFLDEPTLGLDIQTRERIHEYIRRLQKEKNMTIFITTHYMEEADQLCDRVAIIDHGQIKAMGDPETLKGGVGGDVVTLKIAPESKDKIQETLAEIKKQPFFENIIEVKTGPPEIPPQVAEMMKKTAGKGGGLAAMAGKIDPEILKSMQATRKSGINGDNVFNIIVKDGATALPQIFKVAENMGAIIASISVKRPSLDDVFLAYTGRALREEEGSRMEHMMQAFRMRRARQ
ncbi:MAG: ATP-binding cassette domain-containing protein [Promethearchaeati archaeon SRVP18_Atabeyarchaeia-1]